MQTTKAQEKTDKGQTNKHRKRGGARARADITKLCLSDIVRMLGLKMHLIWFDGYKLIASVDFTRALCTNAPLLPPSYMYLFL